MNGGGQEEKRPGFAPGGRRRRGSKGAQEGGVMRGGPPMGMPVQKAKDFRGTLLRLAGYFRPQWFLLLIVLVAAVLSTLFGIISPKIMGNATTDLYNGYFLARSKVPGAGVDFHDILRIIITLAILYVLSSIFSYVQQYLMAGIAQRTIYALRKEVNEKLSKLPLSFYDTKSHGDILSRFVNDFDNIANTLQQSLTQFITSVVTLIGVVVMMFSINWLMTVVIFLTLPLSMLIIRVVAKRSQRYFSDQQRTLGELNGHVEEMFTGHQIVKAFGHVDKSIEEFEEINEELYVAGWKAQFVSGIIMPLMNSVGNLGFVFVSVLGGILVTRGTIKIGNVQAFISYARQFSQPITQLSSIANIIQSTMASAERVFELLDEKAEVETGPDVPILERAEGDVDFEGVVFGYKEDSPVIRDLTIHAKSGQTIAIVGPTGAGKTTLVNLLMRFYDVDGGKILVDGMDIAWMQRHHLRSLFGMVLQDTWLFHGTIRENIAYGRADATREEVVDAARAAYADHFIRTLPDGYDTVLNEDGSNISQGQRQLLTIARAILSNPSILILDEATSSVDTRTEANIQRAMTDLMQGRTSFVIAHRLSTIRDADLILVMNHGEVIEQGTHEQLLAKEGFYADLYNSQFTGKATPDTVLM